MKGRLGNDVLPLDPVEEHIAFVVYGKQKGQALSRRITPIACILIWAGICEAGSLELILR